MKNIGFFLAEHGTKMAKCATIIMINPSFADEIKSDTIVMKVGNFLANRGYGSLQIVNLFSYISTHPEALVKNKDVLRAETDSYIKQAVQNTDLIIIGW
jgi:hypothetical protein